MLGVEQHTSLVVTLLCRSQLSCQIFNALQQARQGQLYHATTMSPAQPWSVSLPWLTYSSNQAASVLSATDVNTE